MFSEYGAYQIEDAIEAVRGGGEYENPPREAELANLICSLLHYCDKAEISKRFILNCGIGLYRDEQRADAAEWDCLDTRIPDEVPPSVEGMDEYPEGW